MNLITIITVLQATWVVFIIAMLFIRFRVGLSAYLAYILLVPYMHINLGIITLQWNFVNVLLLIAFLYDRSKYEDNPPLDWRPFYPFLLYFGCTLLLMPFQEYVPFSEQMNTWRTMAMKYLILPFVIWNDILADSSSLKLYRNVVLSCITISILYGLFLTTMPGLNPYMMVLCAANGSEFNLAYAAGNSGTSINTELVDGRLFGRISSVFSHPMTFGLSLGLSVFYLYRNRDNYKKWIIYTLMALAFVCIITCGVRSVIGAAFIAVLYYLIHARDFKTFAVACIVGASFYYIIPLIPGLSDYLGSLTGDNDAVRGSSFEMRIKQFEGCLSEIKNCFIEGKGFGWTGYYIREYGGHPTMLHFESLIIVVLCNMGLIGVLIWTMMTYTIFRYNNIVERSYAAMLNALFVFYVAYACITGEYGYMQYFIIFYTLMLAEDLISDDDEGEITIEE